MKVRVHVDRSYDIELPTGMGEAGEHSREETRRFCEAAVRKILLDREEKVVRWWQVLNEEISQ